jgi:hypothetical protein
MVGNLNAFITIAGSVRIVEKPLTGVGGIRLRMRTKVCPSYLYSKIETFSKGAWKLLSPVNILVNCRKNIFLKF